MSKLFFIGTGLFDARDITLRGLDALKISKVYLEDYTSLLQCSKEDLEKEWGVSITSLNREEVEQEFEKRILPLAKEENIALVVIGDPFGATTHSALLLEAKKLGIEVEVIHNASIINAVGEVGLNLYKYGQVVSLPYPVDGVLPMSSFSKIMENSKMGLHTLVLLDIKMDEGRFMTINEAIDLLFGMGFPKHAKGIAIARIGCPDSKIVYGKLSELEKIDFGKPLHSLIIPGKLHFMEEEIIEGWKL